MTFAAMENERTVIVMAEYTNIETARSIICDMCECLYPDGYCPEKCDSEKCDWMELLKEDAADVAPVRHGRWVSVQHKLARVCSVCNRDEPYKFAFADIDADLYDYCPNCGARMDGDSDAEAD